MTHKLAAILEQDHGIWCASCACGFVVRHPGRVGTEQRFETHLEIQRARAALAGEPHLKVVK